MIESRPEFDKITSFDEFNKYYWYHEELSQICKTLGLEYRGTKQELNYIIEQYFKGDLIKKSSIKNEKKQVETITLDEYIKANCEYPGNWNGEIERIEDNDENENWETH